MLNVLGRPRYRWPNKSAGNILSRGGQLTLSPGRRNLFTTALQAKHAGKCSKRVIPTGSLPQSASSLPLGTSILPSPTHHIFPQGSAGRPWRPGTATPTVPHYSGQCTTSLLLWRWARGAGQDAGWGLSTFPRETRPLRRRFPLNCSPPDFRVPART